MTHKTISAVLAAAVFSGALFLFPAAAGAGQDQTQVEDQTYIKDSPLRWELVRRLAEQSLEANLPKAGIVLKDPDSREFEAQRKWSESIGKAYTDWSDVLLYQKKSDNPPGDQKEWAADYNLFLSELSENGKWVARWLGQQNLFIENWTKAAENAPLKIEELKKNMREADAVLAEVKDMMYETWSKDQLKNAPALLERAKRAAALLEAAVGSMLGMYEAGVNMGGKPEYSDMVRPILNGWKSLPDGQSAVLKPLRQLPKDWLPIVQARLDAAGKAFDAAKKAYEPILKKTINSGCQRFNGTNWESFREAAWRDVDYLSVKIAGEGRHAAIAAELQKAEDETVEKEKRRLVEINQKVNPGLESRLILALDNADSDGEKAAARAALAKYRAEAAELMKESDQIIEKHRQRRKKLGLGLLY